jgi:amino acid adenylation domain-containing protein
MGRPAGRREVLAVDDTAQYGCPPAMTMPCVHEMFEMQASRAGTPAAVAVEFRGVEISYRELNERANRLAHYLIGLGVGPGTLVGMRVPRDPAMLVCMLATMKAGAAYLPLDASDSSSRAKHVIEASGMSVMLTADPFDAGISSGRVRTLQLATLQEELEQLSAENPRTRVSLTDLVYVMYTSGSTGVPKGVALPHASVANLISWHRMARQDSWGLRTLQCGSPEFDFSFHEIFSTLCSGGTLVMATEDARYDPQRLAATLRESRVEKAFLPVSVLLRWAEALRPATVPSRLKCVITTGEQLRVTRALRAAFKSTGAVLHNHYGATEFQDATSFMLKGDPDTWPYEPPVGFPIANVAVHVCDEQMRPVPPGDVGQIYVSGMGLARGYIGSPELTAARFLTGPSHVGRVYATGDIGFVRPDGALVHLGRHDRQLKLAGRRVELGEIEQVIADQAGVAKALVMVRQNPRGDAQLIGYVAADGDDEAAARITAAVRARLPPFMVPRHIVVVDEFPLTRNGKVDVAALPDPETRECDSKDYATPRNTVEQQLAAIWSDVLQLERVGVHDNFFEVGGDSTAAVHVASRARAGGIQMTAYDVFRDPTVALLAAAHGRADASERTSEVFHPAGASAPAALQGLVEKAYRLTGLQEGLLFHDIEDPTLYVVQRIFRIVGPLDLARFRLAWDTVVSRHEALRTAVCWQDVPRPVQVVHRRVQVPWHFEDWGALPAAEQAARQAAYLQAERARGLAVDTAPLLRISVFRCADHAYRLIATVHHIVMDGWSWEIVFSEALACYRAALGYATPDLPPATSYQQYVDWLGAQDRAAARAFWSGALAGLHGPTQFSLDHRAASRETALAVTRGQRTIELPVELSSLAKKAARQMRVTINTLCQAVWALTLSRHSGQTDLLFGTVVSGRSARIEGAESIVGLLANTIPVRAIVRRGERVARWLGELQSQQAEARAYEYASLAEIHRWSGLPADREMFESITVHESYLGEARGAVACGNVSIEQVDALEQSNYPLSISTALGAGMRIQCAYDATRFGEETIARFLEDYQGTFQWIVRNPEGRI